MRRIPVVSQSCPDEIYNSVHAPSSLYSPLLARESFRWRGSRGVLLIGYSQRMYSARYNTRPVDVRASGTVGRLPAAGKLSCFRYLEITPSTRQIAVPAPVVAVGTAITDRPPHRSVRARLRIRLLLRMSGGEACIWIRMQNAGLGNPPLQDREETSPAHLGALTATN